MSRKTRTKSKTRNNAKSRAKKATGASASSPQNYTSSVRTTILMFNESHGVLCRMISSTGLAARQQNQKTLNIPKLLIKFRFKPV